MRAGGCKAAECAGEHQATARGEGLQRSGRCVERGVFEGFLVGGRWWGEVAVEACEERVRLHRCW